MIQPSRRSCSVASPKTGWRYAGVGCRDACDISISPYFEPLVALRLLTAGTSIDLNPERTRNVRYRVADPFLAFAESDPLVRPISLKQMLYSQ